MTRAKISAPYRVNAPTRGVAQTGLVDLNLSETPRFTLAVEDGRPVYVRSDSVKRVGAAIGEGAAVVAQLHTVLAEPATAVR